ncbi:hypothetical protein [Calothrix sp. CCY 0018]|uniref:hypothetical protein n=1 Tax=Calothrix sp. CCY 0018 TaxID=3103864 RepID=UPI0039C6B8E4
MALLRTKKESKSTVNTEELTRKIRKTPMFRKHIPMEAGIGWPIPLQKEGKLYVILPCFGFHNTNEKGKTALFPPFATITIDWSKQEPVAYHNLRKNSPATELTWDEQTGFFPHEAVAKMTIGEYKQKRSELLAMYDEMFQILEASGEFSSEWVARFSSLLRTLMEPQLEVYYRVLAPTFFERFLVD